LYEWIRRGRLVGAAGQGELSAASANLPDPMKEADDQLQRTRDEFVAASPEGSAVFFLQGWPAVPTRLEKMFDLDGPKFLFSSPPPHRSAGFNWWGLQPELDVSRGLRVSSGNVLALWITPAAVMTLVVGQEYLTWATERYGLGTGH